MGSAVGYIAPTDPNGAPGIDAFSNNARIVNGAPPQAKLPTGPFVFNYRPRTCHPSLTGAVKTLCLHGQVTHGALPENLNTSASCTSQTCPPLPKKAGPTVTDIYAAGFTYGAADLGVISATGIPQVKRGTALRF